MLGDDTKKPIIFIHPMSNTLVSLFDELQKIQDDLDIEVLEAEDSDEAVQVVSSVGPCLMIGADVRTVAKVLMSGKKFIKKNNSKAIVVAKKGINPKAMRKLQKLNLADLIIEPIALKSLFYKIKIHLRTLSKAKQAKELEMQKLAEQKMKEEQGESSSNSTPKAETKPGGLSEAERKMLAEYDSNSEQDPNENDIAQMGMDAFESKSETNSKPSNDQSENPFDDFAFGVEDEPSGTNEQEKAKNPFDDFAFGVEDEAEQDQPTPAVDFDNDDMFPSMDDFLDAPLNSNQKNKTFKKDPESKNMDFDATFEDESKDSPILEATQEKTKPLTAPELNATQEGAKGRNSPEMEVELDPLGLNATELEVQLDAPGFSPELEAEQSNQGLSAPELNAQTNGPGTSPDLNAHQEGAPRPGEEADHNQKNDQSNLSELQAQLDKNMNSPELQAQLDQDKNSAELNANQEGTGLNSPELDANQGAGLQSPQLQARQDSDQKKKKMPDFKDSKNKNPKEMNLDDFSDIDEEDNPFLDDDGNIDLMIDGYFGKKKKKKNEPEIKTTSSKKAETPDLKDKKEEAGAALDYSEYKKKQDNTPFSMDSKKPDPSGLKNDLDHEHDVFDDSQDLPFFSKEEEKHKNDLPKQDNVIDFPKPEAKKPPPLNPDIEGLEADENVKDIFSQNKNELEAITQLNEEASIDTISTSVCKNDQVKKIITKEEVHVDLTKKNQSPTYNEQKEEIQLAKQIAKKLSQSNKFKLIIFEQDNKSQHELYNGLIESASTRRKERLKRDFNLYQADHIDTISNIYSPCILEEKLMRRYSVYIHPVVDDRERKAQIWTLFENINSASELDEIDELLPLLGKLVTESKKDKSDFIDKLKQSLSNDQNTREVKKAA